jgi:outer membrane immunogenic protein
LQLAVSPDIFLTSTFGGVVMKKPAALALLTTVSPLALLLGSPANAADLARKAPMAAPPPAPVYSWTGCYVGAHVGWGWGRNNSTEGFNSTFSFSGIHDSGARSAGVDTSGALFGGQVGCNYQFAGWSPWSGSNWVFGVQGDFAGTDFNGRGPDPWDPNDTIGLKSDWLGSVTARLGLTAFNNQALFYVKGGAAWIHNKWDLHDADFFLAPVLFDNTNTGWTIGGGAEWTLWSPNWTAFVEYNYYQFNHGTTHSNSFSCGFLCNETDFLTTGKQQINTVKVGVNYKFGPW